MAHGLRKRDAVAEEVIRSAEGIVCNTGGRGHIFGDYKNLAHKLQDLNAVALNITWWEDLEQKIELLLMQEGVLYAGSA